jgi:hypothetical protein
MAVTSQHPEVLKLVEAICRALDLDPNHVRSLTLNLDVAEPVTIDAEVLAPEDQIKQLADAGEDLFRNVTFTAEGVG